MVQVNNYKIMLLAAVGNTFGLVILMALNHPKGDTPIVAFLGFLFMAIFLWAQGTKKYIDYRFQELERIDQKREIASSPNENVN